MVILLKPNDHLGINPNCCRWWCLSFFSAPLTSLAVTSVLQL